MSTERLAGGNATDNYGAQEERRYLPPDYDDPVIAWVCFGIGFFFTVAWVGGAIIYCVTPETKPKTKQVAKYSLYALIIAGIIAVALCLILVVIIIVASNSNKP
eukprot:Platyproteum_vivax@DN972_c0_g1_i1.p1